MENKNKKLKKLKKRLDYIKKFYSINEEGILECDDNGRVLLYNVPLDEWHKRMWEWIATYSVNDVSKQMFIDANFGNKNATKHMLWYCGNCFACLYNQIVSDVYDGDCELCPICEYKYQKGCLDGLYYEYVTTSTEDQIKKHNLTKEIAELDWKWK